ncbi:unnamed protein product [Amoebophrya sp. A120]|nr:unnamed protein product [Amoebophrya sp. A120]|eukprot:GSA120T00009090001.1
MKLAPQLRCRQKFWAEKEAIELRKFMLKQDFLDKHEAKNKNTAENATIQQAEKIVEKYNLVGTQSGSLDRGSGIGSELPDKRKVEVKTMEKYLIGHNDVDNSIGSFMVPFLHEQSRGQDEIVDFENGEENPNGQEQREYTKFFTSFAPFSLDHPLVVPLNKPKKLNEKFTEVITTTAERLLHQMQEDIYHMLPATRNTHERQNARKVLTEVELLELENRGIALGLERTNSSVLHSITTFEDLSLLLNDPTLVETESQEQAAEIFEKINSPSSPGETRGKILEEEDEEAARLSEGAAGGVIKNQAKQEVEPGLQLDSTSSSNPRTQQQPHHLQRKLNICYTPVGASSKSVEPFLVPERVAKEQFLREQGEEIEERAAFNSTGCWLLLLLLGCFCCGLFGLVAWGERGAEYYLDGHEGDLEAGNKPLTEKQKRGMRNYNVATDSRTASQVGREDAYGRWGSRGTFPAWGSMSDAMYRIFGQKDSDHEVEQAVTTTPPLLSPADDDQSAHSRSKQASSASPRDDQSSLEDSTYPLSDFPAPVSADVIRDRHGVSESYEQLGVLQNFEKYPKRAGPLRGKVIRDRDGVQEHYERVGVLQNFEKAPTRLVGKRTRDRIEEKKRSIGEKPVETAGVLQNFIRAGMRKVSETVAGIFEEETKPEEVGARRSTATRTQGEVEVTSDPDGRASMLQNFQKATVGHHHDSTTPRAGKKRAQSKESARGLGRTKAAPSKGKASSSSKVAAEQKKEEKREIRASAAGALQVEEVLAVRNSNGGGKTALGAAELGIGLAAKYGAAGVVGDRGNTDVEQPAPTGGVLSTSPSEVENNFPGATTTSEETLTDNSAAGGASAKNYADQDLSLLPPRRERVIKAVSPIGLIQENFGATKTKAKAQVKAVRAKAKAALSPRAAKLKEQAGELKQQIANKVSKNGIGMKYNRGAAAPKGVEPGLVSSYPVMLPQNFEQEDVFKKQTMKKQNSATIVPDPMSIVDLNSLSPLERAGSTDGMMYNLPAGAAAGSSSVSNYPTDPQSSSPVLQARGPVDPHSFEGVAAMSKDGVEKSDLHVSAYPSRMGGVFGSAASEVGATTRPGGEEKMPLTTSKEHDSGSIQSSGEGPSLHAELMTVHQSIGVDHAKVRSEVTSKDQVFAFGSTALDTHADGKVQVYKVGFELGGKTAGAQEKAGSKNQHRIPTRDRLLDIDSENYIAETVVNADELMNPTGDIIFPADNDQISKVNTSSLSNSADVADEGDDEDEDAYIYAPSDSSQPTEKKPREPTKKQIRAQQRKQRLIDLKGDDFSTVRKNMKTKSRIVETFGTSTAGDATAAAGAASSDAGAVSAASSAPGAGAEGVTTMPSVLAKSASGKQIPPASGQAGGSIGARILKTAEDSPQDNFSTPPNTARS